jgi:hypothetical protein
MSSRSRRNGETDSAARRLVTDRAAHPQMLSMIEAHTEGLEAWKSFQCTGLRICMTDRTDGARGVGKLKGVAAGARKVSRLAREAYAGRISIAPMAKQAGHSGMVRVCMCEARVILFLCLVFSSGRIDKFAGDKLPMKPSGPRVTEKQGAGREYCQDERTLSYLTSVACSRSASHSSTFRDRRLSVTHRFCQSS